MITKISNEVIAELAASSSYKERFIAEYVLLKQKHEKLKVFNTKIEAAGEMAFRVGADKVPMPEHDCPEELLRRQQHVMGEYLHILEVRAVIEGIDLQRAIEALAIESIRRESACCTVAENEGRPCCKSESVPPCEEGIYENTENGDARCVGEKRLPKGILSAVNTVKIMERCRVDSPNRCDECPLSEQKHCEITLNESALYHLKSYAGLE